MKNQSLIKLIVIFFILNAQQVYSQIPNASFENWDTTENNFLPVGWRTISNEPRILRDTISYNGNYSLHIFPDSVRFFAACSDGLRITLDSIENLDSTKALSLHAILKPVGSSNGAFLSIELAYFKDKTFLKQDEIWHYQKSLEWKQFLLPFNNIEKDSIVLILSGGGVLYDTDGCGLTSNVWIDNIKVVDNIINSSTNYSEQNNTTYLYPNPVTDILNIDSSVDWQYISIYDVTGRIIKGEMSYVKNLDVSHLELGTYILHLKNKVTTTNKIFVKM